MCPVDQPRAVYDGFGAPRYGGGYHPHAGNDIVAPQGTAIRAPFDGVRAAVDQHARRLRGLRGRRPRATSTTRTCMQPGVDRAGAGRSTSSATWGRPGTRSAPHDHFEWHPNVIPTNWPVSPYGYSVIGDYGQPRIRSWSGPARSSCSPRSRFRLRRTDGPAASRPRPPRGPRRRRHQRSSPTGEPSPVVGVRARRRRRPRDRDVAQRSIGASTCWMLGEVVRLRGRPRGAVGRVHGVRARRARPSSTGRSSTVARPRPASSARLARTAGTSPPSDRRCRDLEGWVGLRSTSEAMTARS